MADDYQRLEKLETLKGTLQYGQNLQITPGAGAPDLVQASKDLIRFVGEKTDVNAWRVYLGPWQVRPDIVVNPLVATTLYANPTPWAPPEPRVFDSFADIPVYARVMWGSGGIQHTAFVDWPERGLLLQVSGSYLQVNAFVDVGSPGVTVNVLPFLQATMGPEPGGGDSTVPATFTYDTTAPIMLSPGEDFVLWHFQIPPFARAFVPIFDAPALETFGAPLTIATQRIPAPIAPAGGAIAGNDKSVWQTGTAGVFDPLFGKEPFPITGQRAGVVTFQTTFAPFPPNMGCMFFLDL